MYIAPCCSEHRRTASHASGLFIAKKTTEEEHMTEKTDIRESTPDDVTGIEQLYPEAFPDEDLLPVVRELLGEGSTILSLVGTAEGAIVGHVIFTTCTVSGSPENVSLLGPLGVIPDRQKQGIGSALVRKGLEHLKQEGTNIVFVLGDPAYYGRFGFATEDGVQPPYPLPEEWYGAWQSLNLSGDKIGLQGTLAVPKPWRQRALWVA